MLETPPRPRTKNCLRRALQILAFVFLYLIFAVLLADAAYETAALDNYVPCTIVVVGEAL